MLRRDEAAATMHCMLTITTPTLIGGANNAQAMTAVNTSHLPPPLSLSTQLHCSAGLRTLQLNR